jgi:hypothetical protein
MCFHIYCNYNSFTFIVTIRKQCAFFYASARLGARLSYNIGDISGHIAFEIRIKP